MDSLNRLHDIFKKFPGIGPRQARRFVYFLLNSPESLRSSLAREILDLASHVSMCSSCHRYFDKKRVDTDLCVICRDTTRDTTALMVVAKDVDLDAIEKSHVYNGFYFVLGDALSLIEKDPDSKIRSRELLEIIEHKARAGELKEIILALSLNTEGEHTREYVEGLVAPLVKAHGIKVSTLGRGLSTGTELEYSDAETIKNALLGRKQEVIL